MKAGDLFVSVSAEMGKFNTQMKEVEAKATNSGQKFGQNFQMGAERALNYLLKTIVTPYLAADIADGITAILQGSTIQKEFSKFIENLPLVGAFAKLGGAIEKSLSGEAFDVMLSKGRYAEQAIEDAKFAAEMSAANQMNSEVELLKLQQQRIANSKIQNGATRAEVELKQQLAVNEKATLDAVEKSSAGLMGNVEYNAFLKLQAERRIMIQEEFDEKMRQVEKIKDAELKAALDAETKLNDKREEDAKRAGERKYQEDVDKIEDLDNKIKEKEATSKGIMQQTSEFSTVAGTFKISGYTDQDKRKHDDALLREIIAIRKQRSGIMAESGGFS